MLLKCDMKIRKSVFGGLWQQKYYKITSIFYSYLYYKTPWIVVWNGQVISDFVL